MIAFLEQKHLGPQTIDASYLLPEVMHLRENLETSDRVLMENLLREPVEFMDNPRFHDPKSEREIAESYDIPMAFDSPESSFDLFLNSDDEPANFKPLTPDQEVQLFIKMNYARYRVYQLVKECDNHNLTLALVREILRWLKIDLAIRGQITQANIPLVLAMVKRTKMGADFTDLVSEGSLTLLRSIDKFDAARGFKFSTYACRGILKSFSRIAFKASTHRQRFSATFDPEFEKSTYLEECRRDRDVNSLEHIRGLMSDGNSSEVLTPIEKQVLMARFGIPSSETEPAGDCMTLEKVGTLLGLSKERVRQIQNHGFKKLRDVLEEYVLKC